MAIRLQSFLGNRHTAALGLGAILLAILWANLSALPATAAEPQQAEGEITHVTLYRGQALVTRTLRVEGAAGPLVIEVGDLPVSVLADSLFAEGDEGIEVRAVRYRERAVGEETQEQVRDLDAQLQGLSDEMAQVSALQQLLHQRLEYLDQMRNFVVPTAHLDLSEGVLDAESLQQLATFDFEQRQQIAGQQLELAQQQRELQRQSDLIQRQRAELTRSQSLTVREAVIFIEKRGEGAGELRLNYLVGNCGWSPSYVFRTEGDGQQVEMEYSALIQQMSGEDWSEVELTLSTATPALAASVPGLAPLHVSLVAANGQAPKSQAEYEATVDSLRSEQAFNYSSGQTAESLDEQLVHNWRGNELANRYQQLELACGELAVSAAMPSSEAPSLNYDLSGTVSLASRSDQQIVMIARTELPSEFYHVAVPLLSSYLHRQADVKNDSDFDLLGGPMTVYLNGRFVGRGEIPMVARGQTFVVGFGANPQLRAKRELIDVGDDIQGGNRRLTYEYRIVLENYSEEPVAVRVFDRLPNSQHEEQIQIRMIEGETSLSEDALYLRTERPTGILRWDIEVPAGAVGEDALVLEFGFSAEFDRNFQLGAPGSTPEQLEQEFYRLQDRRLTY